MGRLFDRFLSVKIGYCGDRRGYRNLDACFRRICGWLSCIDMCDIKLIYEG